MAFQGWFPLVCCSLKHGVFEPCRFFHQLIDPDRLLDEAEQATRSAACTSRASGLIKRALRKEALDRMDRERAESHAIFAAEWTSTAAQTRIQAALRTLRAPR